MLADAEGFKVDMIAGRCDCCHTIDGILMSYAVSESLPATKQFPPAAPPSASSPTCMAVVVGSMIDRDELAGIR